MGGLGEIIALLLKGHLFGIDKAALSSERLLLMLYLVQWAINYMIPTVT